MIVYTDVLLCMLVCVFSSFIARSSVEALVKSDTLYTHTHTRWELQVIILKRCIVLKEDIPNHGSDAFLALS